MSIVRRKLPSGRVVWRARVFFQRRVVAEKVFDKQKDAKLWESEQTAKFHGGSWVDPERGKTAFSTLAEEWQLSRAHLAVRSQETTWFLLDAYIVPVIGRLPIAALSAVDIDRVLAKMTARGLATVSRRRALSVMRLVLDYGVRDRRITANVARTVAPPRGSAKREPHWLNAKQLAALASAMPAHCAPVVLFLGLAGCRFSEMAALRVADVITTQHGLGVRIHRAAPQSKVTHAAVIGPTKTHQTRTVPVPSAIEDYVRERVASSRPDDYLFPSPTGVIWTNTNFRKRAKWAETTAAVGLGGTTIHDLRHTAASLLIASGADIKAVQAILGHASGTMTMDLYGHLFSDAPWVAISRLPDLPGFPGSAPADGSDSANAAGDATAP